MISKRTLTTAALAVLLCSGTALAADAADHAAIDAGKKIAFDRLLGNCLACHQIEGGEAPGTIGPPLVQMKQRYPDKAKLRAQIFDPTVRNPNTAMPPFGRHEILTNEEIDKVADFIWSL